MPRPTNSWKQVERRVAADFDTRRTPLSGINSGHTSADTLHERLFIEVKQRKKHTLWTLFDSVKSLAKRENKIPVIAISEKNRPGYLICIHIRDLQNLIDEMKTG